MTSKTLMLLCALALGFVTLDAQARAADPMSGMDMSGAKAQKPTAAPLSVTATVNPAAPRTGDNTLDLMIADASGKPVTGLKLTTSVAMTSMDMGTTHPAFTDKGNGHYVATISFAMDGPWRVVIRNQGSKLAVLDFASGSKSAWKAPVIKATAGTPSALPASAAKPAPMDGKRDAMAGMDMSGGAAAPPGTVPSASTPPPTPAKSETAPAAGGMTGMNMSGSADAGTGTMKMGIADMKTAQIPQLQEKGTYMATGTEDWKTQTGFGHNAGMVGMMNQMMVGGSGMEGMKMPAMTMKFDAQNYAKSDEGDSADAMPGMDMSGNSKSAEMPGMKMDAAAPAVKPDASTNGADAMPGMTMAAPSSGDSSQAAAAPVTVAATVSAPKAGDNALTIRIADAQGKPVPGAKITASVAMTSMDMGTSHPAVTDAGNGIYKSTVMFSMAGPWRVTMKVTTPGQKPQMKSFDFNAK